MIRSIAAVLALACLAACASTPGVEDLTVFPASLAGRWDNAAQYDAAPDDLKRPPTAPDDEWLNRVSIIFSPVRVPATLAPAATLVEWRGSDNALLGRGVWAFRRDADSVQIDLYELVRPSEAPPPDMLDAADLRSKGSGCALMLTGAAGAWNAQTDPETCRAGDAGLDIRITAMPTGLLYQETERNPDGSVRARSPGGPPYDLRRRAQ